MTPGAVKALLWTVAVTRRHLTGFMVLLVLTTSLSCFRCCYVSDEVLMCKAAGCSYVRRLELNSNYCVCSVSIRPVSSKHEACSLLTCYSWSLLLCRLSYKQQIRPRICPVLCLWSANSLAHCRRRHLACCQHTLQNPAWSVPKGFWPVCGEAISQIHVLLLLTFDSSFWKQVVLLITEWASDTYGPFQHLWITPQL